MSSRLKCVILKLLWRTRNLTLGLNHLLYNCWKHLIVSGQDFAEIKKSPQLAVLRNRDSKRQIRQSNRIHHLKIQKQTHHRRVPESPFKFHKLKMGRGRTHHSAHPVGSSPICKKSVKTQVTRSRARDTELQEEEQKRFSKSIWGKGKLRPLLLYRAATL